MPARRRVAVQPGDAPSALLPRTATVSPCPQESISEAVNAWYSLQLYGSAIGDDNMVRTARMLLAHEMEAGRVYWRSTQSFSVYPPEFAKHKGVGMIWEDKVALETWFGAGPVYALAINMMPYTPLSQFYLRKEWVKEALPILEKVGVALRLLQGGVRARASDCEYQPAYSTFGAPAAPPLCYNFLHHWWRAPSYTHGLGVMEYEACHRWRRVDARGQ